MLDRFKILQVFGVATLLASFAGGFYSHFFNYQMRVGNSFWLSLLFLGMFARSAGEAGTLRERHSDKLETMHRNDLIIAIVLAAVFAGALIWLVK